MKKVCLIMVITALFIGCTKHDIVPDIIKPTVNADLKIANSVGIKLQSSFVTTEVAMNVKLENAGSVTIKIFDISNRVVSKEQINVTAGDNILKVYTSALPASAYRIGLYDSSGTMLGITDFNKL